jgi:hypothetical protein
MHSKRQLLGTRFVALLLFEELLQITKRTHRGPAFLLGLGKWLVHFGLGRRAFDDARLLGFVATTILPSASRRTATLPFGAGTALAIARRTWRTISWGAVTAGPIVAATIATGTLTLTLLAWRPIAELAGWSIALTGSSAGWLWTTATLLTTFLAGTTRATFARRTRRLLAAWSDCGE